MPLRYAIDPVLHVVTITGDYGEPSEWRTLLQTIGDDPQFGSGYTFLRDLRSSANPVSADSVVGIIAVVRQFWSALGVRKAAIVTRPGIDIPATIAHALAEEEHIPLRAFNSYDDAIEWLSAAAGGDKF